jgi:hypothetical protein
VPFTGVRWRGKSKMLGRVDSSSSSVHRTDEFPEGKLIVGVRHAVVSVLCACEMDIDIDDRFIWGYSMMRYEDDGEMR